MTAIPESAPQQPASEHLGLAEKLSYGLGDFASCLYWQTFMVYLTFFYTDIFGISALAAGFEHAEDGIPDFQIMNVGGGR